MVIVQRNVLAPTPNPVTPELGELGAVIVPLPLTKLQMPVPTVGVFPANVVVAVHNDWSGPALAVVGAASIVTIFVHVLEQPFASVMVMVKVKEPAEGSALTLADCLVFDPLICPLPAIDQS